MTNTRALEMKNPVGRKRMMLVLLLLMVGVTGTATASGWKRPLHVEWGYAPPADLSVRGFKLYQGDAVACEWTGGDLRSGDCEVNLTHSATAFSLAAQFGNGEESPKSAAYMFPDVGPGPQIIILIGK